MSVQSQPPKLRSASEPSSALPLPFRRTNLRIQCTEVWLQSNWPSPACKRSAWCRRRSRPSNPSANPPRV